MADDDDSLRMVFAIDEAADLLLATGYQKALAQLHISDKESIRSTLIDYHCILKVKVEGDQFADGLQDLDLLTMMKQQPLLFKPLFVCPNSTCLAAGIYIKSTSRKMEGIHLKLLLYRCWHMLFEVCNH